MQDPDLRDMADILLEPELISHKEGGKTLWWKNDYIQKIKLVFLARIKEYTPLQPNQSFEALFGSARLSIQLFDRWWTIRELYEESAESMDEFVEQFIHLVDASESEIVNGWLERFRAGSATKPKE